MSKLIMFLYSLFMAAGCASVVIGEVIKNNAVTAFGGAIIIILMISGYFISNLPARTFGVLKCWWYEEWVDERKTYFARGWQSLATLTVIFFITSSALALTKSTALFTGFTLVMLILLVSALIQYMFYRYSHA